MFANPVIAGLLAVSLFAQGLPLSACRCVLGKASAGEARTAPTDKPICPHCVAERKDVAIAVRPTETVDASPCCGSSTSCPCCVHKSTTRAVLVAAAEAPERPLPQAIVAIDPLAARCGDAHRGVTLDAAADVHAGLPKRIWGCVWRI